MSDRRSPPERPELRREFRYGRRVHYLPDAETETRLRRRSSMIQYLAIPGYLVVVFPFVFHLFDSVLLELLWGAVFVMGMFVANWWLLQRPLADPGIRSVPDPTSVWEALARGIGWGWLYALIVLLTIFGFIALSGVPSSVSPGGTLVAALVQLGLVAALILLARKKMKIGDAGSRDMKEGSGSLR